MLCSPFTKTIAPGLRASAGSAARPLLRSSAADEMTPPAGLTFLPTQLAACNFITAKATTTATCGGCGRFYQRNMEISTLRWLQEYLCGICVTPAEGRLYAVG